MNNFTICNIISVYFFYFVVNSFKITTVSKYKCCSCLVFIFIKLLKHGTCYTLYTVTPYTETQLIILYILAYV